MLSSNTMHYGHHHLSGNHVNHPGHMTSHHGDHRNHFLSPGSHHHNSSNVIDTGGHMAEQNHGFGVSHDSPSNAGYSGWFAEPLRVRELWRDIFE